MTALALLALWSWQSASYRPADMHAVSFLRVEQWRDLSTPEALVLVRYLTDMAERPKGTPTWLH